MKLAFKNCLFSYFIISKLLYKNYRIDTAKISVRQLKKQIFDSCL